MNMKLLFWMNVFMLHFGIAYYLKDKINAELTAIIDTPNKPKQMFLNQKIVNFKKTWYFHDHIKKITATPDLEYLAKKKKKYNIDLWKLAINERHFYKFNKFYKFSINEILKFLEQECKLFEQILEEAKQDYFLTYDPPFHHQKLLMDLCKAKGIKVLCIFISRYKDKSIIAQEGSTFNLPQNLELIKLNELETNRIDEIINKSSYNVLTKKWTNERNASTSNKIKALTKKHKE